MADAVTAAATTTQSNSISRQAGEAADVFQADFETFLKLLTTQLQFQDPLQPLESTQFVAQLAQFSTVEQQIQTNTALGRILDAMGASGAGALGAWLGKEVRGASATTHEGGPLEAFIVDPPLAAESAQFVVRGVDGSIIRRVDIDPRSDTVVWDGRNDLGEPAPSGTYAFEARYSFTGGETEVKPAEVFSRVVEARRNSDDSVSLVLESGLVIPASDVTALRG